VALTRIAKHTFHPGYLTPQSIVIDGGANKGEFCHAVIEAFGCQCLAIEPNPEMFARIAPHARLRKINVALHRTNEQVQLNISTDSEACSLIRLRGTEYVSAVTVAGRTLASVAEEEKLAQIDLLKLDIEGAEVDVFASCTDELLKRVGQITVEFHDDQGVMTGDDVAKIVARLRDLNFYVLYPGRTLTPWDVLFVNGDRMSLAGFWWNQYALQIPTAIRNRWRRARKWLGSPQRGQSAILSK
jgi:FkbM family methyltransferase